MQRAVELVPLDKALLREILEDAGDDIARRVERRGVGAAPLEQYGRRAIIVGLRIGAVDQRPDLSDAGVPAVGRQQAELRIDLVDAIAVIGAAAKDDGRIPEIERTVELKVDDPGKPAFGQLGGLRLENIDARQRFGRHVLQVEVAADGRKHLAAIDRGEHVGKAADAHIAELVVAVYRHLDAGYALERGGSGGIGKLADVLRDDRIDDLHRLALDIGGALERAADAGDDDRIPGVFLRRVDQRVAGDGAVRVGRLAPRRYTRDECNDRHGGRKTCLLLHLPSPSSVRRHFCPWRRQTGGGPWMSRRGHSGRKPDSTQLFRTLFVDASPRTLTNGPNKVNIYMINR